MSQGRIITVIVAEDEPIIKNHIIHKIEQTAPDFKVVASTFNGKDALDAVLRLKPDVVFTDIRMPVSDGMELITNIRSVMPYLPIVVLSGYDDFEYARQALRLSVLDYLLKPLETDMLMKTLDHIRDQVLSKNTDQQRQQISSKLHGEGGSGELPGNLEHAVFQMFLICAGNLCNHITSLKYASLFKELWLQADWTAITAQISTSIQDWWLIDEKMPNQKFLIIAFPEHFRGDLQSIGGQLSSSLLEMLVPYPITVCTHGSLIRQSELWETAQHLRLLMEQGVCLGKSQVLIYAKNQTQHVAGAAALSAQQLKPVLDNRRALRKLIYEYCAALGRDSVPQRQSESSFAELIRIIERSRVQTQTAVGTNTEYEIAEITSTSIHYDEICDRIWALIERGGIRDTRLDGTSQLVESLTQYIKNHYSEDISLEELAQQMNFSSAYLTKIFKKHMNESPLKYMINYRMSEAKRLLIEHPDLDIRIIAEMTGYFDQHYFSKVFKSIVGQTPSEFRISQKI
ncbi:response regulator transcription factor [Paenibacillus pedocola]|uniref:response regulator transcription factor n=1 Tax=Paenibacillus pedocola TaxID=3242193 RepID=UPI00287744C5|nr:response regulator [Paenibacillus typhae]